MLLVQPILLLALLVDEANADELAPQCARGKLTINITVKGEGHLTSGKVDFDSTNLKVSNTLGYSAPVIAQNPLADTDGAEVDDMAGSGLSAEDEAVQAEWDKKLGDCNGDEDCENAVLAAMMADPGYQKMMADMQKTAPDIMSGLGQINLGPNLQLWLPAKEDEKGSYGRCRIDREDWIFGVMELAGGRSNGHTRYYGEMALGNGPDELNFLPTVTIDKQAMTYKIELDASYIVSAKTSLEADGEIISQDEPSKVNLLGNAPGGGNWKSALTLTGKVDSVTQPNFKGKKSIKANLGNPDDPHFTYPVTVTIEWKFESGS